MSIRPLHDCIVIRPVPEPEKHGDIFIPEAAREKQSRFADVVAVGDGRSLKSGARVPIGVAVGDRIAVYRGATDEFEVDGERVCIIREMDVLAVMAPDEVTA